MRYLRYLMILLTLAVAATVSVHVPHASAQPADTAIDYSRWDEVATFSESAVELRRASNTAFEELRSEIANWRKQFQAARDANSSAIDSVRAQLEALGPAPENGSEGEEVAAERAQLNARLAELEAPVKKAELAHSRAESLIAGIDTIIRERQAEELLELGPSPLNPTYFDDGIRALTDSFGKIGREVSTAWSNPLQRAEAKEDLPAILFLMVLGILLIARGRRWTKRVIKRLTRDRKDAGAGLWVATFAISLGSLILPWLGTYSLIEAAYATGLLGVRGDMFLSVLLRAVFIYLLVLWLSQRIFPASELRVPFLNLDVQQRRYGRLYTASLGLVIASFYVLTSMSQAAGWPEQATNVVLFPLIVVASLLLVWLVRILILGARQPADNEDEETYRGRFTRLMLRAVMVLAVVAPVLAAIGYFKAAQSLMLPSLFSLMLVAALIVLQRLVNEVYALLRGRSSDGVADSLTPVLIGFVLVLLSLPIFALIWGARLVDLTELWTQFTEGVSVGGVQISPAIFLTVAIVFAIGYALTRALQGTLKNTILPKTKLDMGGRNAVVSGVGYIGIFLAALIAITSAGIDLSSLAIVAGALSVGIGFGLQNIVSNFVSGIILLIERPISQGDWIEVGGIHGTVKDISVRSTVIETFDRSDVIVPNADFVSGRVTNYTRGNTVGRLIVPVGVAYGSDTKQVEKILREVAEAHPMVLANPAPNVLFRGFGADSLDFEIRAILRDVNWVMNVHSDMNHEIAQKFSEQAIEIPFAQRDVWLRNPETLTRDFAEPKQTGTRTAAINEQTEPQGTDDGDGDGE